MSSACCDESSAEAVAAGGVEGEIMLFGVRVKVDPMRKSVSLSNLSQYEQPNANNNNESSKVAEEGYASADDAVQHQSNSGRERKRGVPWTEEEHKLFLLGLQKVGKGDWRGISRNFVKTRTPTQVASHAQKYFLRRSNLNRRRRRSSLFDITTDSVSVMPIEEGKNKQEILVPAVLAPPTLPTTIEATKTNSFPVAPIMLPAQIDQSRENPSLLQRNQVNSYIPVRPVPTLSMPNRATAVDLNVNQNSEVEPLSLRLSLSLDQGQASSTRHSAFKVMSSFSNGENIISVA
ncbi:transcription factor MYB1R1-like [Nicotiana sylvestris]|uniref:Transcription factor MYB1R1-like n=2 Tax=Nicotiana TaxID=4085 RepID=A0A1S4BYC0_TOBAC|nr:PREDICTED: transcription factor MYB1R1-like [Nicotiana sylvestris]XP_016493779.1 PREDICTED: transcription factor MYB1R1-like [Nicotiana tabacum]